MTFSKLIKSNKGSVLQNRDFKNLYKPNLNKLNNKFINDFTIEGPELNKQLLLNIYKFLYPNINLYKIFLFDFYTLLIKYKEFNKKNFIDINNSQLSSISKIITNIIFPLYSQNKNNLNKNISNKDNLSSIINFILRDHNIKVNKNKFIKKLGLKLKLRSKIRFSNQYFFNQNYLKKQQNNLWGLFLISRQHEMKYTTTNFINYLISKLINNQINIIKNKKNYSIKEIINNYKKVEMIKKSNTGLVNKKINTIQNKQFSNYLNEQIGIIFKISNQKNNLLKFFKISIFFKFLIYNLFIFQNLTNLYHLINIKMLNNKTNNIISKKFKNQYLILNNTINSNSKIIDLNNKIIKLHFKLYVINDKILNKNNNLIKFNNICNNSISSVNLINLINNFNNINNNKNNLYINLDNFTKKDSIANIFNLNYDNKLNKFLQVNSNNNVNIYSNKKNMQKKSLNIMLKSFVTNKNLLNKNFNPIIANKNNITMINKRHAHINNNITNLPLSDNKIDSKLIQIFGNYNKNKNIFMSKLLNKNNNFVKKDKIIYFLDLRTFTNINLTKIQLPHLLDHKTNVENILSNNSTNKLSKINLDNLPLKFGAINTNLNFFNNFYVKDIILNKIPLSVPTYGIKEAYNLNHLINEIKYGVREDINSKNKMLKLVAKLNRTSSKNKSISTSSTNKQNLTIIKKDSNILFNELKLNISNTLNLFKNKLKMNYSNLKNYKLYDRSLKVSPETIKTIYYIYSDNIINKFINKKNVKLQKLTEDINNKVISNLKLSQHNFIKNNFVILNNKYNKNITVTNTNILLKIVCDSLHFFNYQLNDRKILAVLFLSQFKFQDFFNSFIKFIKFLSLQRYLLMSFSQQTVDKINLHSFKLISLNPNRFNKIELNDDTQNRINSNSFFADKSTKIENQLFFSDVNLKENSKKNNNLPIIINPINNNFYYNDSSVVDNFYKLNNLLIKYDKFVSNITKYQSIGYNFVDVKEEKNKLSLNHISKLIKNTFLSMGILISKPIFNFVYSNKRLSNDKFNFINNFLNKNYLVAKNSNVWLEPHKRLIIKLFFFNKNNKNINIFKINKLFSIFLFYRKLIAIYILIKITNDIVNNNLYNNKLISSSDVLESFIPFKSITNNNDYLNNNNYNNNNNNNNYSNNNILVDYTSTNVNEKKSIFMKLYDFHFLRGKGGIIPLNKFYKLIELKNSAIIIKKNKIDSLNNLFKQNTKINSILNKFKIGFPLGKVKEETKFIYNKSLFAKRIILIYKEKLKLLTLYLSRLFNAEIEFKLIKLNSSLKDSKILVENLGISSYKRKFSSLMPKLLKEIKLAKVTGINRNKAKNLSLSGYRSSLVGLFVRLGGRTFKQKIIPRKTVSQLQRGFFSKSKVKLIETSRFTNKIRRGSFTYRVILSHIF